MGAAKLPVTIVVSEVKRRHFRAAFGKLCCSIHNRLNDAKRGWHDARSHPSAATPHAA